MAWAAQNDQVMLDLAEPLGIRWWVSVGEQDAARAQSWRLNGRCSTSPTMGEIDMNTLGKARMAFKIVCSLVFSVGMLTGLPGTAVAQPFIGSTDFCDDTSYDNGFPTPADPQTTGYFTDLRRGTQINADYDACVLNLTGSVGSAGGMWITLLNSPLDPTPPTFICVRMRADVVIHKFDNRKAVGFVTNFQPGVNPGSGTGLFFGLYDNGNTDALTLSTFADGKLTGTVATLPLGSKIKENVSYILEAVVCSDEGNFYRTGALVTDLVGVYEILGVPNTTALPSGISPSGLIGIAGYAKSSFVDSSVADFGWTRFDVDE